VAVSNVRYSPIICQRGGIESERTSPPQRFCRGCADERERERQKRNAAAKKKGVVGSIFICEHCGEKDTRTNHRQKYCRGCHADAKRKQNTEAARERRKRPESKAKERERATTRNAAPERRLYIRGYERKRRKTDPKFAVHARMKAMVANVIRGLKNGRSWQELVGYTADELMAHLERQFLSGMNWENRDRWHIDHIVPVSSFSFVSPECPDFKACWALTNLRPLWSGDNIRKKDKRIYLL
jgi:hypothetical protein